ncbi:MAG: aspartate aminotransferase family protein [Acidimicrobiales bacterium]
MTELAPAPAPGSSHLMGTYGMAGVRFSEGRGAFLYDDQGKEYLDFLSGIAVTSLGHSNPVVGDAVILQAKRLWHVSNLFQNELAEPLAAGLDELVGDGRRAGGKVFFANSGAEANECAIKLARRHGGRGRYGVVSAYGSFHGRSLATLHATGQPEKHEPFQPLPEGFSHVAYGDVGALEAALDPNVVSAVLLEAIQGENGVVVPPAGYVAAVRALCDERGILLILDEVQTGLGRTWRWFGFQHDDVRPDIVTVAKALGNGMPVGACWARAEVASAFRPGDHGSTFGGQPLACSAALATLGELRRIDAPARSARLGQHLGRLLVEVEGIASVRGRGLLLGAVLEGVAALRAKEVVAAALGLGLVVNSPVPGVIRLAPPLTVEADEIERGAGLLARAIEEVAP